MRNIILLLCTFVVMGLGAWSYQENYKTRDAMARVDKLHREIASSHAWLSKLKAEWAYQNRPDRLRSLAKLNYERLGLLPFMPEAFGSAQQIGYPAVSEAENMPSDQALGGRLSPLDTPFPVHQGAPL